MARLRLYQGARSQLKTLARKLVGCPAEEATLAAAYEAAAPAVRAIVHRALPPRDMAVYKRYDPAYIDDCIRLRLTSGGVEQFLFDEGTGPLVVHGGGCLRRIFLADETETDLVQTWIAARDAHKAALKAKLSDYDALISQAKTLEDVTAIWPEAERLRSEIGGHPIVAFAGDVADRIRADVAARLAA
ncbi:MAG: hypothetical protein KGL39_54735 [Patescibacteria group bacterium]|nr:hypothetical protein [Patescibacteria group bacterium]